MKPTDGWLSGGGNGIGGGARMTADELQAYADELNARTFTRALGCSWLVASRRREDGTEERYLDRRGNEPAPWTPAEGEVEAIRERAAGFLRSGMSQAEFNRLVDEGKLS